MPWSALSRRDYHDVSCMSLCMQLLCIEVTTASHFRQCFLWFQLSRVIRSKFRSEQSDCETRLCTISTGFTMPVLLRTCALSKRMHRCVPDSCVTRNSWLTGLKTSVFELFADCKTAGFGELTNIEILIVREHNGLWMPHRETLRPFAELYAAF